jgi:hypothetical protein
MPKATLNIKPYTVNVQGYNASTDVYSDIYAEDGNMNFMKNRLYKTNPISA